MSSSPVSEVTPGDKIPTEEFEMAAPTSSPEPTTDRHAQRVKAFLAQIDANDGWEAEAARFQKETNQQVEANLKKNMIGMGRLDLRLTFQQNEFNKRTPQPTAINAFFFSTQYGKEIRNESVGEAVTLLMSRHTLTTQLTQSSTANPMPLITWNDEGPPPSLVDGAHRCLLARSKIIKPIQGYIERAQFLITHPNTPIEFVGHLRHWKVKWEKELEQAAHWVAIVYDRDSLMEDENAAEQIVRLCGNKRMFVKPDTEANKILTLLPRLSTCPEADFEDRLASLAAEIQDAKENYRLKEVLKNGRLVRTLLLIEDVPWLWTNPDEWLLMTHLRFVATHSEGVLSVLITAAYRQLAWIASSHAQKLPPYEDHLAMSVDAQKANYVSALQNYRHVLGYWPSHLMDEADRVYTSTIGRKAVLQLFGAHPDRHPARCKAWNDHLTEYFTSLEKSWVDLSTDMDEDEKRLMYDMLKAMQYLRHSRLLHYFGDVMYGRNVMPLLTSSFLRDLVYLMSPTNEKDNRSVLAWKEAWISLTGAEEWRTVVSTEDGLLGHGVVAMNNKYTRLALDNPRNSETIAIQRTRVFLENRLAGFQKTMQLYLEHSDTFRLTKRLPIAHTEEYASALGGQLLVVWLKPPASGSITREDMLKVSEGGSLSPAERNFMENVYAMLYNSEANWQSPTRQRASDHREALVKDILYVLIRLQWWNYLFMNPSTYRMRHEWLSVAGSPPSSWYKLGKGMKGWDVENTEEHDRDALVAHTVIRDQLSLSKTMHEVDKVFSRSDIANYVVERTDVVGQTSTMRVLDDTILRGLNYIAAGTFKMQYIREQKIQNPDFDEQDCTEEWAIGEVKKRGKWRDEPTKPSERSAHWKSLHRQMAVLLGEIEEGAVKRPAEDDQASKKKVKKQRTKK
ncbi:hypothetical protein BDZ89DRAFT_1138761 [Hymenopellis radicata]|nr:hypothetical protein BDZ89DRAFT_1138761 [Hymenopellis radicata]